MIDASEKCKRLLQFNIEYYGPSKNSLITETRPYFTLQEHTEIGMCFKLGEKHCTGFSPDCFSLEYVSHPLFHMTEFNLPHKTSLSGD
jgi:hypothetical protein